LRAARGLPSFRQQLLYLAFLKAFRTTRLEDFRIVEFSVQTNHVHLVVEAEDNDALARGMKSFAVRANRLFNAASGRRRGKVWAGRYHRADLKTPRQVRNALVYVLHNGRKHGVVTSSKLVIDACSSAPWFAGWTMARTVREGPRPTEEPRTFLLARLWQKHGRIHPTETPGSRAS
jgi:REP element-mobilizing transposase RayT